MERRPHIYVALPVMDELNNLPETIRCLHGQTYKNFTLVACVNQPEEWWDIPEKRQICEDNQKSIMLLRNIKEFECAVIDKSSRGIGWSGKQKGVGWARKLPMDLALTKGQETDIILSMDADTVFHNEYFLSVAESLATHHGAVALSVPYYHKLTGNEDLDRAILRYEIYLCYYALNLWRINNPYCFTAIGSAMALPLWAYRRVGGITPKYSGEDFYFMQKLCKSGRILHWNREKVYPAARFSDRVNFGTGPALIRGNSGNWNSYPVFPYHYFDEVGETYGAFFELYDMDLETPMDGFLRAIFREADIWSPLRLNTASAQSFVKACSQKADGLRIFQYLRQRHRLQPARDENSLMVFCKKFIPDEFEKAGIDSDKFSFVDSSPEDLDKIRNVLVEAEELYQKKDYLWEN